MFISICVCLILLLNYYFTKNHDYWAKRNVKYDKPIPLFGNLYENMMGMKSITEVSVELYNKYPDEKAVGFYRGRMPELLIRDLDIAKRILNTDFAYFYSRGIGRDPQKEPLTANIFHLDGDMWKLLRQRLTKAFTTMKLKKMFPLIVDCTKKLQNIGDDMIVNKNGECDVNDLMVQFTLDFIGACGFGLQIESHNKSNSLFTEVGKKIFQRSWKKRVYITLWYLLPHLRWCTQILISYKETMTVIEDILRIHRAQRSNKPSNRNDFIDLLLELEAQGTIRDKSLEKKDSDGNSVPVEIEINSKLMAAQMYVFLAAGFETSASSTSYTLHQLAYHPEIQDKIQTEIDAVLKKHNNQLCYDAVSEMTLLSYAFKETMRIFAAGGVLNRECTKQYMIPELGVTIDPGVKIMIPVQAIQMDEKYFDNPLVFNPERFADPAQIQAYSYMPFGEGPRQCIGARLGEMQSLAGLAAVLQRFTVEPTSSTRRHPVINPKNNLIQSILGGLPLKLKRRSTHSESK